MIKNKENFKNNTTKKSKIKKVFKIFGFFVLFIVFITSIYFIDIYFKLKSGDIILWDNDVYTREEFAKKYPPQYYDVPAKNTPEEVYATFRQALLDGDIELALEQIADDSRNEYQEFFSIKDNIEKYYDIPDVKDVKKAEREAYGNFCSYYYIEKLEDKNKQIAYSVDFIKDNKGFWKIENI